MGFFKKLFGAGVVAGTTVAAVKVAEKVKANRAEGMDSDGDGKVDAKGVFDEVVKAAGELYQETADAVKEKAPEFVDTLKEKAEEVKEKAPDFVDTLKEKAEEVKEKAPDFVSSLKEKAGEVMDSFKGDFGQVVDATAPDAESAAPEAETAAEE